MRAMHDGWMSAPQVMRHFGNGVTNMGRRTLYRLIESGSLKAKDIGDGKRRCYIFHQSYIEEFRAAVELKKPEE